MPTSKRTIPRTVPKPSTYNSLFSLQLQNFAGNYVSFSFAAPISLGHRCDGVMQPEWDYLRLPELTLVSINIPSGLPVLAS